MEEEIKHRTKYIALEAIKIINQLPATPPCVIIGRQLIRSATSIGANYRAACRAKSRSDFINKLKIVEEEADETIYWLELLVESGFADERRLTQIKKETNEILAIIVASIKTIRLKPGLIRK